MVELIAAFAAIGGGLKFIDEAFDEGIFSKRAAILLAPVLVAVWIAVSIIDAASATILFSILAGVLLAGKIDNAIFKTSSISLILAALLSGKIGILWPLFLALTIAGIIDEIGNNYVDSNRSNKIVEFFFLHRFTMKIGVFSLCAISMLPWRYLLAFLAFDVSYDLVGMIGQLTAGTNPVKRPSLTAARRPTGNLDIKILTTAALLCNELPKDISNWTFYPPGKKLELSSALSTIALELN